MNFNNHLDNLKLKLNKANCLLSKIRHYVSHDVLKTIYHALFESHLRYGCEIWGQTSNLKLINLEKLQNKALRILNFKGPLYSSNILYKETSIIKLKEIVKMYNCRLVFDQLNGTLPDIFHNYFTELQNIHDHDTRGRKLNIPASNTVTYGSNSITIMSIKDRNNEHNKNNINFHNRVTTYTYMKSLKKYLTKDY